MFNEYNPQNAWRRSSVFVVNFEHISHLFLVFLLFTKNTLLSPTNSFLFQKGKGKCDAFRDSLHLYNSKRVKNTHGGVLLLGKLQASAYDFTRALLHGCFPSF